MHKRAHAARMLVAKEPHHLVCREKAREPVLAEEPGVVALLHRLARPVCTHRSRSRFTRPIG